MPSTLYRCLPSIRTKWMFDRLTDIGHHLSAFLDDLREGGRNHQYRECSTEGRFIISKYIITRRYDP